MRWDLVTGEYPPQVGGVSDYLRQVAQALTAAGDETHVWAPPCPSAPSQDGAVIVHRLPDCFGWRTMATLGSLAGPVRPDRRWLVQYTPRAFGWQGMNVPFCLWLSARGRRETIWTMFHEVVHPFRRRQPLAHNAMAAVTRVTAFLVARASTRIFVSIPAWEVRLRRLVPGLSPVTWLPIPSGVPVSVSPDAAALTRKRLSGEEGRQVLGHFGTFGGPIRALLMAILPPLLEANPRRIAVLVGRGSERFAAELRQAAPSISGRVHATGGLPPEDVAAHLAACDVLLQPYPDGVSSRRSSVMAGLALGLPVVTTHGFLTEDIWDKTGAVALVPVAAEALVAATDAILSDPGRQSQMALRAAAAYHQHFALERTVLALRGDVSGRVAGV